MAPPQIRGAAIGAAENIIPFCLPDLAKARRDTVVAGGHAHIVPFPQAPKPVSPDAPHPRPSIWVRLRAVLDQAEARADARKKRRIERALRRAREERAAPNHRPHPWP